MVSENCGDIAAGEQSSELFLAVQFPATDFTLGSTDYGLSRVLSISFV
jgi:hypothetical protein